MSKNTVREVLEQHNLMHIASLDQEGNPCVRGVDYAIDEENFIYFITFKQTRKVEQIRNNQNISFAIDHDCGSMEELQKLKYIKGAGKASIVTNPEEAQKGVGLIMQKFPYLAGLPGKPEDMAVIKVEMKEVLLTDNTISFGHTEPVSMN